MTEYTIERATAEVPLSGTVAGTPWRDATVATIDTYPWDTGRDRQSTTARVLYDDRALYLQFQAEDTHSVAETSTINGPVFEDSCVEWFFSPGTDEPNYFNFEVNCIGAYILGWGPNREQRDRIPLSLTDPIRVNTSLDGPTKSPSPADEKWWVAVALPYESLAAFGDLELEPTAGTVWEGNFQRLGGDSEFAVWSDIDSPDPEFHSPDSFVQFTFA